MASRTPACHPDRAHYGRDLCASCYRRAGANPRKALCHKERTHFANGLCLSCVNRAAKLRRYGLDAQSLAGLIADQGNVCALCKEPFADDAVIDHDHATERIRGVLHRRCNSAIGLLGEDRAKILRAYEYLSQARNA